MTDASPTPSYSVRLSIRPEQVRPTNLGEPIRSLDTKAILKFLSQLCRRPKPSVTSELNQEVLLQARAGRGGSHLKDAMNGIRHIANLDGRDPAAQRCTRETGARNCATRDRRRRRSCVVVATENGLPCDKAALS
jgi:hypothetical protein